MNFSSLRRTACLALAGLLATVGTASAHHVIGGGLPSTFSQGLLSGLGHPVIGPDHLAFLIAVGIAVGAGGLSLALPIVFVAASAIGVALHVYGLDVPGADTVATAASATRSVWRLVRGHAVRFNRGNGV